MDRAQAIQIARELGANFSRKAAEAIIAASEGREFSNVHTIDIGLRAGHSDGYETVFNKEKGLFEVLEYGVRHTSSGAPASTGVRVLYEHKL